MERNNTSTQITLLNITAGELQGILQAALELAVQAGSFKRVSTVGQESIWLSRREAAEHLKISLPTLDKLSRLGKITGSRLERHIRFNKDELDLAISNLTVRRK